MNTTQSKNYWITEISKALIRFNYWASQKSRYSAFIAGQQYNQYLDLRIEAELNNQINNNDLEKCTLIAQKIISKLVV